MSKSSAYWKKRFEILEEASNAYGIDAYRRIESAFEQAEREIQSEIEKWYGRFAKNNNVSIEEARKYLSSAELKELKWDVKQYIKYGKENGLNQQWMRELENASSKYHISRLEALKLRTQQAAEVAFGNELDEVDAMSRKVFGEGYHHCIFEVQKGFNLGWEIGQINERKLEKIVSKPWAADGKHFSERIWEQRTQLVNEVHNQLTRAVVLGKAPDDAIRAISKKFGVSKNQAGRLVMTEQAYFHSVAQKEAFNELEVEEFEIVATLDSATSPICQEMDGKHFPMKDYQPGVTAPPFHPWCRSVTVPYFEDNFTERVARDVDGKTYYVPDDMKYKDWKKSQDELYGAGTVDKKRKMIYNESADKVQFGRYKERLGDDAPKSFKDFQKIKYDMVDEYTSLYELYVYKGRVPEATVEDYKAYKAIKATGVKGTVRVPPKHIDISVLEFKDGHAENHGCTLEDAIGYVKKAKCSISRKRWDGNHTNYYSFDGATYVEDETNKIKTAFPSSEFDTTTDAVMGVFK